MRIKADKLSLCIVCWNTIYFLSLRVEAHYSQFQNRFKLFSFQNARINTRQFARKLWRLVTINFAIHQSSKDTMCTVNEHVAIVVSQSFYWHKTSKQHPSNIHNIHHITLDERWNNVVCQSGFNLGSKFIFNVRVGSYVTWMVTWEDLRWEKWYLATWSMYKRLWTHNLPIRSQVRYYLTKDLNRHKFLVISR